MFDEFPKSQVSGRTQHQNQHNCYFCCPKIGSFTQCAKGRSPCRAAVFDFFTVLRRKGCWVKNPQSQRDYQTFSLFMHIFSSNHSQTCKRNRLVKDGIQGRRETQDMFCLCFFVAKIALEYTQEYLPSGTSDSVAFNSFSISPLMNFLVTLLNKKKKH